MAETIDFCVTPYKLSKDLAQDLKYGAPNEDWTLYIVIGLRDKLVNHYTLTAFHFYIFDLPAFSSLKEVNCTFYWSPSENKISSALPDSPQYSSRSHQCCGLDGLSSSLDNQFSQYFFQVLPDIFRAFQLWLVSLSNSCSTTFSDLE